MAEPYYQDLTVVNSHDFISHMTQCLCACAYRTENLVKYMIDEIQFLVIFKFRAESPIPLLFKFRAESLIPLLFKFRAESLILLLFKFRAES